MVVTCDIQFENNPAATYYAGQVMAGKVTLTSDKIKQVKAVNLKINGSAKTRWANGHSKNITENVCLGQVDYIDIMTCLLAPQANAEAVIIEPGIHTFSFACHIPNNCPSSFEGDHGSIRYIIKVWLQRPWKYDQTFSKAFTVLKIMNLNYNNPDIKLPAKSEITKRFCCGPFKSDSLQINVQLPQTGYVPGQLIPVTIFVKNDTLTRVYEICVRLLMLVKYFSKTPESSANEKRIVSKLIGDIVPRNCKQAFNYFLPIPATPPTCTTLCDIIKITYRLEVEAKMQGLFNASQCTHTDLIIGNVPLHMGGMVVQQQPKPGQLYMENEIEMSNGNNAMVGVQNDNEPTTVNENVEPWSDIKNIPAPVYMEATHMPQGRLSEDYAHEYGEKIFIPKYPVFNIPSPSCLHSSNGDATDGHGGISMAMDPNTTTWL